jgi:hypothetical protein
LLLLHSLMGASPVDDILGILVGHLFFFLDQKYPQISGKRLLKTPNFLNRWFPPTSVNIYGMGGPGVPQQAQAPQGGFMGGGRRLGT